MLLDRIKHRENNPIFILITLGIKCTTTMSSVLLFDGMSERLFLNLKGQKSNGRRSHKCRMVYQIMHLHIQPTEHLQVSSKNLEGILHLIEACILLCIAILKIHVCRQFHPAWEIFPES